MITTTANQHCRHHYRMSGKVNTIDYVAGNIEVNWIEKIYSKFIF